MDTEGQPCTHPPRSRWKTSTLDYTVVQTALAEVAPSSPHCWVKVTHFTQHLTLNRNDHTLAPWLSSSWLGSLPWPLLLQPSNQTRGLFE